MPLDIPSVPLKYFLIAHFVFVTWAALVPWLQECYIYSNYLVLIIGLWAMKDKNSMEPMQFLLGAHLFTILNDIILLGMWFEFGNRLYLTASFRFTASMAIINLILKPVSALFIYKEYQSRGASESPYEDLSGGGAGAGQGPPKQQLPDSAPPSYIPSGGGGYMPPTSANAPYSQGSY